MHKTVSDSCCFTSLLWCTSQVLLRQKLVLWSIITMSKVTPDLGAWKQFHACRASSSCPCLSQRAPQCLGRPLCVACMQHRQDHQLHFSPLLSTPVQWTNCTTILGRSISRSPESFISVPCKLGLSCIICSLGWGEEWGRRCFCFPSRFTHKLSHTKPKQMSESS
jgi:hypothetical protein